MSLLPLTRYGKILRSHEGYGELRRETGKHAMSTHRVNLVQISDGRIYGHFAVSEPINKLRRTWLLGPWTLKASTDAGAGMEASSIQFTSWTGITAGEVILVGICDEVTVNNCATEQGCELEFHYGLTNVNLGIQRNRLLQVGEKAVEIRPIKYYKEAVTDLKAKRGVEVTCEVVFHGTDSERADVFVRSLCWLLGLALGTYITWVYRDIYLEHRVVGSFCHHPRTRPFCFQTLIPNRPTCRSGETPDPLADFVAQIYDRYIQVTEQYRLVTAITLFQEARLATDLESKIMYGAIALDALRNSHIKAQQIKYVVDLSHLSKGDRKAMWAKLRDAVVPAVNPVLAEHNVILTEGQEDFIRSRVHELVRANFRTGLKSLFDTLGVDHTDQDLRLIQERNAVIHRGELQSEPEEAFKVAGCMDDLLARTLLAILKYQGPYLDYTSGRAVTKNN